MRLAPLSLSVLLFACDPGMVDGPLRPDGGEEFDAGRREVDAGDDVVRVDGGSVMHDLCGVVQLDESLVVPAGSEVAVCAGSTITLAPGSTITVEGVLRLQGSAEQRVQLQGDPRWDGLVVEGTLEADFTDIYEAEYAIRGGASSTIRFDDGLIYARATRSASLDNGGSFSRTRVFGGGTFTSNGGVLEMVDSEIDLDHPERSPDCTHVGGGTVIWDHVRFTNCHCPVHITRTDAPVQVTASVFDGAVYPVMVARSSGVFSGNVMRATASHFLDIGGGLDLDIAGNYYEGAERVVEADDPSQFRGADARLDAPPADAGPRTF